MKKILLILLLVMATSVFAEKPAYRIFNAKGKEVSYDALLKAAVKADIVLFGESHFNPICHWLELQLTRDLYEEKKESLILGAEMFERDNQLVLNEYLSRLIRKKDFESEAKLWVNYKTDYAPLVDFAREKNIPFVATNVPKRFASLVNLKGFEGLDSINSMERGLMAPLPIKFDPELACYKEIGKATGDGMPAHMTENLAKAQALKDATMAHFIMKNYGEHKTFLHFNGTYHSDNHSGMVWYLEKAIQKTADQLTILTVSTVEQDNPDELEKEALGKGDFILCIPADMTKTRPEEIPEKK